MSQSIIYGSLCLILSESVQHVDWAAFTPSEARLLAELARAEGVAPLLYAKLQGAGDREQVPVALMDVLAAEYYRTAAQNALFLNELARILTAFSQAGISVIVLKGAALAQTLYPDPALRPMGDLDLLVRPADLAVCVQMAHTWGYTQSDPEAADGLNQHLSHHVCLRQEHGLVLELHWQLLGGEDVQYATQADWFWGQTVPLVGAASQLNPLANLIYLAAHAVLQHGAVVARLLWFYDLDLIIRCSAQDISAVQLWAAASKLGLQGALAVALRRCQSLYQTPVPAEWLAAIPADLGRLDDLVTARQQRPRTRFEQEHLKLRGLSWAGRVRLIAALIFPSPAYMRWRYQPHPNWLWPVYYFYRWGDVLGDVLKTALSPGRPGRK